MPESPRRIVITGATRGLGRAMALEFARQGHVVIGCGRSDKPIAEMSKLLPTPHRFSRCDVASDKDVAEWASEALRGGAPDLLLNNAALMNNPAPLWNVGADEFSRLVDVNIKGVASVIRHFVPAMIASKKRCVIVNFSSGWGRGTSPEVAPYCASKWAVEGLTKALAQELPRGIGAVALNPGVIDTDMLRQCWSDEAGAYPPPEEWARRAVPYLLKISPDNNGGSLTVPG